jgi:4-hydroxybenzoate polyprenyltransferase
LKLVKALINSNIYISLAAVFLTVETQIQLGMQPQWHAYLFIIFFATLFEYNLHRFITILTNKKALDSNKHKWVKEHLYPFYVLVFISVVGFIAVALMAKRVVLYTLAPIAILTLFYSTPVFKNKKNIFRFREIPYMKIVMISFVWSASTILLPIIQANRSYYNLHVLLMLMERFFFVFAITIPFDIRDIEADKQDGLKTIPLLFNEQVSYFISYIALVFFFLIACFNYHDVGIIIALGVSAITTFISLSSIKIRALPYYHYGVLDGTMLLQGLLVWTFHCVVNYSG